MSKKKTKICTEIASISKEDREHTKALAQSIGVESFDVYYKNSGAEDAFKINDKEYIRRLAENFDPNQKFSKEELIIIDNLRDLMGYHDAHNMPGWFVNNFLKYWHGVNQKHTNNSVNPDQATLYDLRMFIQTHKHGRDYIWNLMSNPKKGQFHWKNFLWFPDTIGKQNETFDYKLSSTIAYIKDYETGNLTKAYAIKPTSTMSELHNLASSINDMISGMQNYRDINIAKDFDILDAVNATSNGDGYYIFDYAVAKRELGTQIGNSEVFLNEYNIAKKKFDEITEGKKYLISTKENDALITKQLTAEDVVDIINTKLTKHLDEFYDTYVLGNMPEESVVYLENPIGNDRTIRLIDVKKTFKNIWDKTRQTQDASTMVFGLNNINKLNYQQRLQNISKELQRNGDKRSFEDIVESLHAINEKYGIAYTDIGYVGNESYFPHLNHPDKYIEDFVRKNITDIGDGELLKDEIERLKFISKSEQNISNSHRSWADEMLWNSQTKFIKDQKSYEEIAQNIGLSNRQKNTKQRGEKATIPGWQRDIRTLKQYEKAIVKAYYNNILSLGGNIRINDFLSSSKGKIEDVDATKWAKFMEIYVRDNLGYPSIFSEKDIQDLPEIKKSFYWKFTDDYVSDKGGKFLEKLRKKPTKEGELEDPTSKFNSSQWLQTWSNFEAKYQLMTLLSRPKTFINNIAGGEPNTLVNVGFRHWRSTFDINFLKSRIDPSFKSIGDAYVWAESHGALESFLAGEISKIDKIAPSEVKTTINRMIERIKGNPDIKDMDLMEIWTKSGLSDSVFDKFAFFMRSSERQLRYRSFTSHYLKAREIFDVSGHTIDPNDPLLISMAQRGVSATQFMYNNANRPAFSRTSLGKVFSRFQLWAWNSTRFRSQLFSDLKQYGTEYNTDTGKRFERLMLADMFILALASMLPFSVFDSVIPQPLSWLKDTAEWLFGDPEIRDSAFFGVLPTNIAPLQIVLPPSARVITPIIGSLFSGDWERMGSYYVYTYFPYGLLARDISKSIEAPINAPRTMLGIPLVELQKLRKDMTSTDEVGWGPLFRKVPKEEPVVEEVE